MRIDDQRESDNIEDRRGMGPARIGKGGLGIGTIVLALAVSYFTGVNPLTVLNLLTGVQNMTEVSPPHLNPARSVPLKTNSADLPPWFLQTRKRPGEISSVLDMKTHVWSSFPVPCTRHAALRHRPLVHSIAPTITGSIWILPSSMKWRIVSERLVTLLRPM